jgi:hypothetical protein
MRVDPPGKNNTTIETMQKKELTKTNFKAIAKQNDNATRQIVIENGVMYEQLTVDDIQYRHKLLSVRYLSMEALNKKVQAVQPGTLPTRLRESSQGKVLAFVCQGKTTLFYHLPIDTREEIDRARQVVYSYAKSLVVKAA